jgi:hypothetical protein
MLNCGQRTGTQEPNLAPTGRTMFFVRNHFADSGGWYFFPQRHNNTRIPRKWSLSAFSTNLLQLLIGPRFERELYVLNSLTCFAYFGSKYFAGGTKFKLSNSDAICMSCSPDTFCLRFGYAPLRARYMSVASGVVQIEFEKLSESVGSACQ